MDDRFMLVGERKDVNWIQMLQRAIAPFGTLDVISPTALDAINWQNIRLAFVDTVAVGDAVGMILNLRKRNKAMHVVVVTYSPTWRRALEAKQAGASQYLAKSLPQAEVQEAIAKVLQSEAPPLPEEKPAGAD